MCIDIGHSFDDVEKHLISNHIEVYLDDLNWFEVCQKENIHLECPHCDNKFESEGSRSFLVHMEDVSLIYFRNGTQYFMSF